MQDPLKKEPVLPSAFLERATTLVGSHRTVETGIFVAASKDEQVCMVPMSSHTIEFLINLGVSTWSDSYSFPNSSSSSRACRKHSMSCHGVLFSCRFGLLPLSQTSCLPPMCSFSARLRHFPKGVLSVSLLSHLERISSLLELLPRCEIIWRLPHPHSIWSPR